MCNNYSSKVISTILTTNKFLSILISVSFSVLATQFFGIFHSILNNFDHDFYFMLNANAFHMNLQDG